MKLVEEKGVEVPESWGNKDLNIDSTKVITRKKMSFATKFFFISLGVFVSAVIIAGLSFYFNHYSSFSENRISFNTTGPATLTSGEEGELTFSVLNNNPIPLEEAYIVTTYDSGENSAGDTNLITKRTDVGDILANDSIAKTLEISVFGSEGIIKDIKSVLYYKIANSNAEFNKESQIFSVTIKTSPVTINVDNLKEMRNGTENTFTVTIKNTTRNDMNNLIVSVRPPSSFVFSTSSLPLYNSNPSWKIQKLAKNSEQKITFSGKITGNIGDHQRFTFYAGVSNEDLKGASSSVIDPSQLGNLDNYNLNIDNVYSKVEKKILISGQYLDVNISYDSTGESQVTKLGELINLEFTYKNNLDYPIDNVVIEAKLSGDGVNDDYTQAIDGYYIPDTNTAYWTKDSMPVLAQIPAHGEGKFKLNVRVQSFGGQDHNIRLQLYAKGERNSESNVSNDQAISIDRIWSISDN